jgi:hypothetical protein
MIALMGLMPPPGLNVLVEHYAQLQQEPVRFRVPSWQRALVGTRPAITALLADDRYTTPCDSGQFQQKGDRLAARSQVLAACTGADLDSSEQVLRAFVLVMAWGSGTTGSRSLRNTAHAVKDPVTAHARLATAARTLRATDDQECLRKAYANFDLPGVRQSLRLPRFDGPQKSSWRDTRREQYPASKPGSRHTLNLGCACPAE